MIKFKYEKGDIVTFTFVEGATTYNNGVVINRWQTDAKRKGGKRAIYEIASMNHSMNSFSIGESCILKKISE